MSETRRRTNRGPLENPEAQRNGVAGHSGDTGDEDEDAPRAAGSSGMTEEDDDDPAERRQLRHQYRELINSVQQNREDILSPTNNKLTEVLEEANRLFVNGNAGILSYTISQLCSCFLLVSFSLRCLCFSTREAALDAQFLVLATDLGKEKANQLHADGSAFDPSAYAEHLNNERLISLVLEYFQLSFMGLNRLEEAEDSDEEGASSGYLPQDAWRKLAKRAENCFRTTPSFHFMLGSFLAEPPPPRQRVERQRRAPVKEAKRIMPTQLKKMEESHQEATEKEVERILGYLQSYHTDDPTSPISYYEFVTDPTSFSRTVENIFHVSFLIRDGMAKIYQDRDKLPCIGTKDMSSPVPEGEAEGSSSRQQCVISISPRSWKEIIEVFGIKEPMISAPNSATFAGSQ
ncbi:non-structural maintenance of chromosomes element 4A-like [Scleropages formosus]|uniref:Non-structural maintenance of chromosomes element 4 n=1 Tax=Scleropages formosus TaxID=113540 RepID=A0A0P7V348_SCLFO|nr:non-structural maintenance of chromosomes element 4A-like [Scleropages formosus]